MTFTRSLARTLGFAVLYLLATYAGRLTVLDGNSLSLVWPAAGILAVWFVVQRSSRWRALDVVALVSITLMINTATGTSFALASWFALANLIQAFVFSGLFHRWLPGVWGRPLARLSELWRLIAAAVLSTSCSALIGPTAVWLLTGHYAIVDTAVWLTRNTVSILLLGVAARRIGHLVVGLTRRTTVRPVLSRARAAEYVAVVLASGTAYYLAFGLANGLPVAFLLIGLTVWAGLRLHTTFVILHDLTFGTVSVLFTLGGYGPFAAIGSDPARALVAQLFVGMVAVVGLALALSRDERQELVARLRASEREARGQAQLMTTIVDSMSEGLAVVDEDGRFLLRNPAAGRLLGGVVSGTDTIAGGSYYGLHHPDGRPIADADLPYRTVFQRSGVQAMDLLVRNEGLPEGRIVSMSVTRMDLDPTGRRPAVIVFHDVTADRRHRDELMSFAGVVAHDLLNPLATIEGWTEALHQDLDPGSDAVGSLNRIGRAADRMRSLINDLLAFTMARDARLTPVPVDLDALVADIATGHVDRALGAGQPVPRFDLGSLDPVRADRVLVRQLLENLIGNSVKYTAPGATPEIALRSGPDGAGYIRVELDDHGIGIPEGQYDAIFANLHRAHRGAEYTGTGLGLAICKRIVERHGGTIGAGANPAGAGTRMTFTLPGAGRARPGPSPRRRVTPATH